MPGVIDRAARTIGAYKDSLLLSGPAGLWMLDESSGTTATDSSGNARHGSYVAGYTLDQAGPGLVSKSVYLTGEASGTGIVTFPTSALTSLTGDFTLGVLAKLSGLGSTYNLLGQQSNTEWPQAMNTVYGTATVTANKLGWRIGSTGGSETVLFTEVGVDQGTSWHSIIFRATGSSPTQYDIFIDGVSIATTTSSAARSNSGNPLTLGRRTASSTQRGRTGWYAGLFLIPSSLSDERVAEVAGLGLAAA